MADDGLRSVFMEWGVVSVCSAGWHFPCGTACRVRDCVLFSDVEPTSLNVLKVTQLLGGDVQIHLLVYLMTKALALSVLSFECHHRSPEHKRPQTALSRMSFSCQLPCGGRGLGFGKDHELVFPPTQPLLFQLTHETMTVKF